MLLCCNLSWSRLFHHLNYLNHINIEINAKLYSSWKAHYSLKTNQPVLSISNEVTFFTCQFCNSVISIGAGKLMMEQYPHLISWLAGNVNPHCHCRTLTQMMLFSDAGLVHFITPSHSCFCNSCTISAWDPSHEVIFNYPKKHLKISAGKK